jgi:hypothetical protein
MYKTGKSVIAKVVIVWLVFALLHYLNDLFPNPVFAFFGEEESHESVWGHLKMNFWTYFFITVGEFFIFHKKIADVSQFWNTRLLSMIIYPWFALVFWMTGSAINGGHEPIRPIELFFSLGSNFFALYFIVRLEQIFDEIKFRKATQYMILFFFILALVQYVSYQINMPHWEFFGDHNH